MLERIVTALEPHIKPPKNISELEARAFKREQLTRGSQTLELVSLEANYITNEDITPTDWLDQISEAIEGADVVFVEYFPPEIEKIIPYLNDLGEFSRNIVKIYGTIAAIAHEKGKRIAVADIANRPLFEAYHFGLYPLIGAAAVACAQRGDTLGKAGFIAGEAYVTSVAYQSSQKKGTYAVKPGGIERLTPGANDARRVLTARGIEQTAQTLPRDASLLYIAAPAHVNRVKTMLTKPKTMPDSAKAVAYKSLIGLNRSTRIYEPTENGWELSANHPIR
jgi:hypothetical protein